jgi:hypothetical protein
MENPVNRFRNYYAWILSFSLVFYVFIGSLIPSWSQEALQGHVQGTVLETKEGLNRIKATIGDLKKTSLLVMSEVTRKDVQTARSANALPNSVIINPVPGPTGMVEIGQLPARQKFLRTWANKMDARVQLLRKEIDALILPESAGEAVHKDWQEMRRQVQPLHDDINALLALCKGEALDSKKIGAKAGLIYRQVDKLEKQRNALAKALGGN